MTVGKKRFSFGQVLLNVFFLLIVLTVAVPVINLAARSFASAKGALQMHGFSLWPSRPHAAELSGGVLQPAHPALAVE